MMGDHEGGDDRRKKNAHIELDISTLQKSRESLGSAGQLFNDSKLSERRLKAWAHYFNTVLKFFRLEYDIKLEAEIEEIRQILRDRGMMK